LVVFLFSVHFILFSSNEVVSLSKEPANSKSHSASTHPAHSASNKFFDWHNIKAVSNASAHSVHSKLKNFFDWHHLKAASNASAHSAQSTFKNFFDWNNLKATDEDGALNGTSNSTVGTGKEMKKTGDGNTTEEYVAICLGVKDQGRDLGEWLTHHYHHVGIKRFYIMDDGSEPPLSTVNLNHSIPESAITFHYQNRSTRAGAMQTVFYSQCNEWHGENHTWIAYIDADEYLEVTSKSETLEDILRSFEPDEMVGALGVNCKLDEDRNTCTAGRP
jgi:hypothetical protein